MKNIKWVGIVDDPAAYQNGTPPPGAVRLDMPRDAAQMMIKAIPFAAPMFMAIFLSMLIKTVSNGRQVFSPFFLLLGVILGIGGLALHELLHAAVYPSQAQVYIGIYPKAFAAVALASYPLSRPRFILMSLLPLALGIVPLVIFWITPAEWTALNGLLFGFSIFGMVSPYPDIYNVYQVLRQTPPKCRVQFIGDDLYYFS